MSTAGLTNPYLTQEKFPPAAQSYRYRKWLERGYQPTLAPIGVDSEIGTLIGQMGWAGSHAHRNGYLWGSAGNMGALMTEIVGSDYLLPIEESPRGRLPAAITVNNLVGRHVLLTKSGCRLDLVGLEHPSLNVTILEMESDGVHYRMRYGTPTISELERTGNKLPKPTSEFFHYMLVFDQLGDYEFNALVHLQPKFLNLISRSEHGVPEKFYDFLKGYEPETPIIYDSVGGIGLVMEKAPGIPELSFQSLRLFQGKDLPDKNSDQFRHVVYWTGHGTFSRGVDILDSYRHAEYFEAAARMAWEANQTSIDSQAYSEETVSCILDEFAANQLPELDQTSTTDPSSTESSSETGNLYNYP